MQKKPGCQNCIPSRENQFPEEKLQKNLWTFVLLGLAINKYLDFGKKTVSLERKSEEFLREVVILPDWAEPVRNWAKVPPQAGIYYNLFIFKIFFPKSIFLEKNIYSFFSISTGNNRTLILNRKTSL